LPSADLRAAWSAEFRREPHKGLWRDLLLRMLAWRLQEKAFGGHDKATVRLLEAYSRKNGEGQLCRRLKAGTVLIREFEGTRHTVTIAPEGYVWQEKTYSSLSAIARVITGTNWNGPRFFGLRESVTSASSRKSAAKPAGMGEVTQACQVPPKSAGEPGRRERGSGVPPP